MNLHELHKYRTEKDHEARYGHLSQADREELRPNRYGFLDPHDKHYHSPEKPQTMEGGY